MKNISKLILGIILTILTACGGGNIPNSSLSEIVNNPTNSGNQGNDNSNSNNQGNNDPNSGNQGNDNSNSGNTQSEFSEPVLKILNSKK